MILLFSKNNDYSTTKVVEWLIHYNAEFVRINSDDLINNTIKVSIDNNKFSATLLVNERWIDMNEVKKIWYRGGNLLRDIPNDLLGIENKDLLTILTKNIIAENNSLIDFFYYYSKEKINIGSYDTYQLNKLQCLKMATSVGLRVPNTIVTTSKKELIEFKERNKEIITKGIQEIFEGYYENLGYFNSTEIVTDCIISDLPDSFFSSLFQEQLTKRVELRIFYLNNDLYTSAIFSQLDSKTKVDFRNYNYEKPNRMVAFKLPEQIEEKIRILMNKLDLNTASIDMIYTDQKEFFFLEINPIGQYDFVSKACNYHLDKRIAEELIL